MGPSKAIECVNAFKRHLIFRGSEGGFWIVRSWSRVTLLFADGKFPSADQDGSYIVRELSASVDYHGRVWPAGGIFVFDETNRSLGCFYKEKWADGTNYIFNIDDKMEKKIYRINTNATNSEDGRIAPEDLKKFAKLGFNLEEDYYEIFAKPGSDRESIIIS